MFINFPSRSQARSFAAKRSANGLPSKVVDNGKDAVKRYAVNVANGKNDSSMSRTAMAYLTMLGRDSAYA